VSPPPRGGATARRPRAIRKEAPAAIAPLTNETVSPCPLFGFWWLELPDICRLCHSTVPVPLISDERSVCGSPARFKRIFVWNCIQLPNGADLSIT